MMEPDTLLVTDPESYVLAKQLMTQMFGVSPLGANGVTVTVTFPVLA